MEGVAANDFLHLPLSEQDGQAALAETRVVGDDGQIARGMIGHGEQEIFRDASAAEPAQQNGGAIGYIGDGGFG